MIQKFYITILLYIKTLQNYTIYYNTIPGKMGRNLSDLIQVHTNTIDSLFHDRP